jgi:hypothetical protein
MARKPDKTRTTKNAKNKTSRAKTSTGKRAKKSKAARPRPPSNALEARPTTAPVASVNVFGMAELVKMFHEAGKEDDLNRILGSEPADRAVKLDAGKFSEIKDFVRSQPEWEEHPLTIELNEDNCQDDDPYCVHWGHRRSFRSG